MSNTKLTYFLCCWAFSFAQLSLIINGKGLRWESFHFEIACQNTKLLTSTKTHYYPAIKANLVMRFSVTYSKCLKRVVHFRSYFWEIFGLYNLYSGIGTIYNCSTENGLYPVYAIKSQNGTYFVCASFRSLCD